MRELMRRSGLAGVILLFMGCGTLPTSPFVPARIVLLTYTLPPNAADSAMVAERGDGPVTMYPIINGMTVMTTRPVGVFQSLSHTPGRITDFDSIPCSPVMTLEFTLANKFGPADSADMVDHGYRSFFGIENYLDTDLTAANLPGINSLAAGDTNMVSGHIYFNCEFTAQ